MRVYLCEKPAQGKDIARVLGATQRGEGYCYGDELAVTWCIGHLIEAAPPEAYGEQYRHWSLAQLPIVPDQWRVEVKSKTARQFHVIERLLRTASALVIATDADREGEMIAREIIERCGYRGPIDRLWLRALDDTSIRKALAALRPSGETRALYDSALGRSRADWLVGMNLSRLFTLLGRQAGYSGVLSVGRVQTPTLKLVVDRDREIAGFVAVPFWAIEVSLSAGGPPFMAHWRAPSGSVDAAGRCLQASIAQQAAQQMRTAGVADVRAVDTERVREAPPLPFDLSSLQLTCSRQLGLGVQETLNVAQSLYETHKATTYPRTDSGYLPESMLAEVPAVLDSLLTTDPLLRPLIGRLDLRQRSRAWDDTRLGAHHGIIPTLAPTNLSAMSAKEHAVYRLIRAHYLAQFMAHHEFDRTTAQLHCGGQPLQTVGKQVVVVGWHDAIGEPASLAADDDSAPRSQILPALAIGQRCQVGEIDLRARKTQPPKAYTQGELVSDMKTIAKRVSDPRLKETLQQTTGIGTEATRGTIIEGLIAGGYLLQQGRRVRASEAAFTLIDTVPAAISDPATTALWEQALERIESGELALDAFVARQAAWVSQLVQQYHAATIAVALPPSPACPRCGSPTRQRAGKRGTFWSCVRYPTCQGTVSVESRPSRQRPRSTPRHPTGTR